MKASKMGSSRSSGAGVTLMELMIALAIVGILTAIAYPSYTQYVTKANRAAAKAVLLRVADRQEQYFSDNKSYAGDLTLLNYGSNGFMIDDQGSEVGSTDSDRIYEIALTNTSATTFTVEATPQLRQAQRDTACQTLTLTHSGQRAATGSGECW